MTDNRSRQPADHLPANEEHERRFLVEDLSILKGSPYVEIKQAYLWTSEGYAVRVRLSRNPDAGPTDNTHAYLTLKGPRQTTNPSMRYEIEQIIDPHHAEEIIRRATHVVTKRRYAVISEGSTFDIDVFTGDNEGLVIAEFEGSPTAVAKLRKPWFASKEITKETQYNNDELATKPYITWK